MMHAYKSKLIYLRLILGMEMLMAGGFLSWSDQPWKHGVLWVVIFLMGGMWLSLSSSLSIVEHRHSKKRKANDLLNRYAITEFFFCGAVWGGFWWETILNPQLHVLDVVAPVNIGFLLFLAFKDAAVKRERAVVQNDARKISATQPVDNLAGVVRLHPERVRG